MKNNPFKIEPPPIHTHYDPHSDVDELCGRVVCPYGFVGISLDAAVLIRSKAAELSN